MKVRVHILFESPGEDDRASMLLLGRRLTNEPQSVVGLDGGAGLVGCRIHDADRGPVQGR